MTKKVSISLGRLPEFLLFSATTVALLCRGHGYKICHDWHIKHNNLGIKRQDQRSRDGIFLAKLLTLEKFDDLNERNCIDMLGFGGRTKLYNK